MNDKYNHREGYPRFYKADFELQKKIGSGPLDQGVVAKMQAYLDSAKADITPQIRIHLAEIAVVLEETKTKPLTVEQSVRVSKAIMNIKSLSGMFHEMMICRVSAFVLTFLEDARRFDRDIVEIMGAYVKVIKTLLTLQIREETNPHGQSFLKEIRHATQRYFDKQISHAHNQSL